MWGGNSDTYVTCSAVITHPDMRDKLRPNVNMQAHMEMDGNALLEVQDPEIYDLVEREKHRQWVGLELIASEVNL